MEKNKRDGQEAEISDRILGLFERLSAWEHSVVAESGLSLPHMHAVELIGIYGPIRMRDLCGHLGVTTGTLTVTIDKLEKAALVARFPNPGDRRSWLIELTAEGKRLHLQHSSYHRSLVREATASFTEEELAKFGDYLKRFLEAM